MKARLLLLLVASLFVWSCSTECEIPMPTDQPDIPVVKTFFDSVDVELTSSWPTQRTPFIFFDVRFRKKGLGIIQDSTNTLTVNGHALTRDSTGKYQGYINDLVEEGSYTFTLHRGSDSGSFELPIPPFNITSPLPWSDVVLGTSDNTTVTYTPAGGNQVWGFYANTDDNSNNLLQNNFADDGTYEMIRVINSGRGYIHLLREFVDSVEHPVFKTLKYQYFTRSRSVNVRWH